MRGGHAKKNGYRAGGGRAALACLCALFLGMLGGCRMDAGLRELVDAAEQAANGPDIAAIESRPFERTHSDTFGLPYNPDDSLNPLFAQTASNAALGSLLYDGLFCAGDDWRPEPVLAAGYIYEDGVFRIRLREDALFSDGTRVRAADAAYSIELARTHPDSRWRDALSQVTSAQAVSDTELVIATAPACGALLSSLDLPIFREGTGEEARPVGAGRYRISEQGGLSLEARDADAGIAHVSLVPLRGADERALAFGAWEISVVSAVPLSTDAPRVSGTTEIVSTPSAQLHYLVINTAKAPLGNAAARRLLAALIDREALAADVFDGMADAAADPLPPESWLSPRKGTDTPPDAAALAAEAGMTMQDGVLMYSARGRTQPFAVTITVNAENRYKREAALALAEQLRVGGVQAEVSALQWEDYQTALKAGNFTIAYAETALPADLSPYAMTARDGALNYGSYRDRETDTLLDALGTAEGGARVQAAAALCARIRETVPIIPLAFARTFVYTHLGDLSVSDVRGPDVLAGMDAWTKK